MSKPESQECYDGQHQACREPAYCQCWCHAGEQPKTFVGHTVMPVFPETPDGEGWVKDPVFPDTYTTEVSFNSVDPDVLGILTGGVMGNPPAPEFSIHATYPPRRRTFWEWLRRKPKHLGGSVFVPNARMAREDETDGQA